MKNAVVTGGAKRIGREMALYLADRGYNIAVHYKGSAHEAQETVEMITAKGCKAIAIQADVLDEDAVAALIPKASNAFGGPITCLVNNASIFEYDNIHSATRASWDRHFESNLRTPYVLSQALAAQAPKAKMDANGEPTAQSMIINMVDQRVRKLTPEFSTYTLAKAALWALTQTSAQGLAPDIRVNAIGPGPTVQGYRQSAEHFNAQRRNTVLQRGSDPSGICAALGFFLDSPAVTGQLLCVDGGQHLGWQTPDVLGVE